MTAKLAHIWRHPIKGIGSEACQSVDLTQEGAVEGDRAFALLNAAGADSDAWQPRRNFVQVAAGPGLAAVSARWSGADLTLTHPDHAPFTFAPRSDAGALAAWIGALWPADRPAPVRLVAAPPQGMTDADFPSVSIGNLSSLRALSQYVGRPLDMRRFRINLWLDGLAPWEEIDLLSGDLAIGDARLAPVEPIERCRAPDANPDNGQRDVSVLRALEDGWSTRDFGVFFRVRKDGAVRLNDEVTPL